MDDQQPMNRRRFLRSAAFGTAATVLAACGGTTAAPEPATAASAPTDAPPAATSAPAATAAPAATTEAAPTVGSAAAAEGGIIPSGSPLVPDAYTSFPEITSANIPVPGRGGTVTTFQTTFNPPPTPKGENAYWQELEKRLGVTWEPSFVPAPSYGEKLAALVASGSLPDILDMGYGLDGGAAGSGPTVDLIKQGALTDLTPYLTGDALKEFPNLAAFPEKLWNLLKVDGKLHRVPRPGGQQRHDLPRGLGRKAWLQGVKKRRGFLQHGGRHEQRRPGRQWAGRHVWHRLQHRRLLVYSYCVDLQRAAELALERRRHADQCDRDRRIQAGDGIHAQVGRGRWLPP